MVRNLTRRSWPARSLVCALAALVLAGAASLSAQDQDRFAVTIESLEVRGNERLSDTEIVERTGLRVGQQVTYPRIQEAIKRLFASGDFADVRIFVGPGRGRGDFVIQVEERPRISVYEFQGLENVSPQMVRDTIGLARDAPLDPDRIARARGLIERVLSEEGFPRASVDTLLRPDPVRPGDYRVTFRVDEGPRLGIARISFDGNEVFSDGRLQGAMRTGEEGFFWWNPGELRRDVYRQDLTERLPQFYASHGYLDFEVVDDTVVVDPATGKGRIRVRVSEGPQYVLEDFRVTGNRRFSSDRLQELVRTGQPTEEVTERPFDLPAFQDATARLHDLYRNFGYLRARVEPDVERLPPAEEGDRPRVVASWQIEEGTPTYIREIRIVGNTYTHDRIIRNQLLIFPGDVYSQDRLVSSIQSIQNLGFFEPLPPGEAVEFHERPDGDLDLTLRVQEKQTGTLNFGVSASGATGFAGFIGYEQPNLFGQAKNGRFRWLFGGRQQDIEVSYSDPELFGSARSASVTLRSSRDQFFNAALGDRRQTGGALEVGTPFFGLRSTRLFVGYSLFHDEMRGLGSTIEDLRERGLVLTGTRSTGSLRLVRDTRNNNLFPTAGSRHMLSTRFTGGPLGGLGEYAKVEFESGWFVPVARIGGGLESDRLPIEFTLGLSFDGGVILGENPFFRERFFMGGVQVGEQLRGYEEATITPEGHVPRNAREFSRLDRVGESYFTTSALFGVKLTNSIFANAFLDAGNVWDEADDLNPTDLLVGAGVGVSLVTPFGPLGIDYAYGFDRRDVLGRPDPGWQLHFKFGRIF